jgi:hydroxyacylglutathione hydrolase
VVALGNTAARVFETPGHTTGHIAYWFKADSALFCGDTLFSLGCGRLFEGSAGQMWASLTKLRALPGGTRVYCAHEYTASNARFALTVEPGNARLKARAAALHVPTVPSLLDDECAANPFLRADRPEVAAALGMAGADPAAVFAELRRRKDVF